MAEPVMLEVVRTPFGRHGAFRDACPDDLLARALTGLLEEGAGPDPEEVEDVVRGTVTRSGEQGANVGRLAVMLAGLEATDGQLGLQVMCVGHGMSNATVLERI